MVEPIEAEASPRVFLRIPQIPNLSMKTVKCGIDPEDGLRSTLCEIDLA
jgi:hypothetical protein